MSGTHAGFIIASYLVTRGRARRHGRVDRRSTAALQRRRLAELEARGVRRRSAEGSAMSEATDEPAAGRGARVRGSVMLLPLVFFVGAGGDLPDAARIAAPIRTSMPSVLIGKPAPDFALPALDGVRRAGPSPRRPRRPA